MPVFEVFTQAREGKPFEHGGNVVAPDPEMAILYAREFYGRRQESVRIWVVPRDSIDRLYWDMPYHLVPTGKTGTEAFAVIREAMKHRNMVALGRLVMSTRERICAIEIEEEGLLMTTLHTAEEVRKADEVAHPQLPKPDKQMLAIAEKIIEQQSGDFDPAEFTDRYEEALRAMIEEKKKGKPVKPSKPANDDGKVVDLMAALKKSLTGNSATRERAERFASAKAKSGKKPGGRKRAA